MAASFKNPKITNAIASDVPEIQQLFNYLAQARPDIGTDYPENSWRIRYESDYRWHFERYENGAWVNKQAFDINASNLDGLTLARSGGVAAAIANKIPFYNASGQLVGNITGNAPTATKLATARSIQCGGIASSTAQNFDGSANITIPINQITVNNSADNALNGTVTKAHGGTGRTDGAASDVVVSGISGGFLATSKGQLGQAHVMAENANADSAVDRGLYIFRSGSGVATNLPVNIGEPCFMEVFQQGVYIEQVFHARNSVWYRYSSDSGASFARWLPIAGNYGITYIYVSKSGSDLNSGLNNSYPVLTITRAIEVARGICNRSTELSVVFCLGAGNWSDIAINPLPFSLMIAPYDGATPTAYSTSLPVFGTIYVNHNASLRLLGVVAGQLYVKASYAQIRVGYKRFGTISVSHGGTIIVDGGDTATNMIEFVQNSTIGCLIGYEGGRLVFDGNITFKLAANITAGQFLYLARGGVFLCSPIYTIAVASSSYTFTGAKYYISTGADISGFADWAINQFLDRLPGTTAGTIDNMASMNGRSISAAIDSQVVHKAGDTMSGDLAVQKAAPAFVLKNPNETYNVAPAADANSSLSVQDKNGTVTGNVLFTHYTTGRMAGTLRVKGHDGTWALLQIFQEADGTKYAATAAPAASANNSHIPTTAWVRSLLSSNSANEVPIGTICAYEGAFTRAIDAAVFFEKQIKEISETLQSEERAARMIRQTKSADEATEQALELAELESEIFKLAYWKEFYKEMASRIPENDGVTLYNAEGNPINESIAYPEFEIQGRAFPNTKWNQYGIGARVLIGEDANMGTDFTYGKTGGSITHTHSTSGSLSGTTLSISQIAAHTHKTRDGGSGDSYASNNGRLIRSDYGFNTETNTQGSGSSHTHPLTLNTTGSAYNYPPYKVVYWIKKVA